jgi:CNT family concentrative nucleoside transporter
MNPVHDILLSGRFNGLLGITVILVLTVMFSENRTRINWRLPVTGLVVNFLLAAVIFNVPLVSGLLTLFGRAAARMSDFAMPGPVFLFGQTLAYGKFFHAGDVVPQSEFIFIIRVGASIMFVTGLSVILYYLGILQVVIRFFARFLVKYLGLSGPESLSSVAAVFLGQVECQTLIRPYMPKLTRSELFTSMTAAMATISGSAFVSYTMPDMDINATYLIAASIMSALNGIILSKIVCPETEPHVLNQSVDLVVPAEGANFFDAAHHGAVAGARIAAHVMIGVAFAISIISMLNASLQAILSLAGYHAEVQDLLAYPMMPVAWLIGTPWSECFYVGRMLAIELLFNEYISFKELSTVLHGTAPYVLSAKAQLVATTAMCGFAHFGSIGINIGGLGAMAPGRREEISKMAFKSMVVANLATWVTASICGTVF